jgi:hypothetical protein
MPDNNADTPSNIVPPDIAKTIMDLCQGRITKPCDYCGQPRRAVGMTMQNYLWGQCPTCRWGHFVEVQGALVWVTEPSAMEAPEGGPYYEMKRRGICLPSTS